MKRLFSVLKENLGLYLTGLIGASLIFALRNIVIAKMLKDLFNAAVAMDGKMLIKGLMSGTLLIVICSTIQPIFFHLFQKATVKITAELRQKLFCKVKNLPIGYFKSEHSGNLISRFTNDMNEFEQGYVNHFAQLIFMASAGIGSIIYMFVLDWRIAIIALITASIGLIINALYAKPLRRIGKEIQDKLGFMTEAFSNIYNGMHVVKSFNLYQQIVEKFLGKNQDVFQASLVRVRRNSELAALNHLARWMDIMGYVLVGAYFAINGWVTVGVIIGISQLKNPINWFFVQIGAFITGFQASIAAGDRIFEVLNEPDEPEFYSALCSSTAGESDYAVILKNIDFGYSEDAKILNNFNLKVKKGTKVALAGPSGSGKSTVFKIILGFYPPLCGEVVISGYSYGKDELEKVRKLIAYVPQNAYLFTGTIADNIRYGNEHATEEDVIRAAKIANAHEFINTLEKGYETLVGERGTQLSGGQRQRIAIARAVLKNAPILLLDEATSSLDTESERLVQEAIDRLAEGRTTLVIAHRFATIKDADEIMVISEGTVKESGSHEELMAKPSSLYRQLHEQQFHLVEAVS